ncbi:MAG: hypothetical protein QW046_02910 [Candidatus Micrarchaeaceae archaeon]
MSSSSSASNVAGPVILSASTEAVGAQFSEDELAIFNRDLAIMAEMPALQRDLGNMLLKYSDVLLSAAELAKAQLGSGSLTFAGLNATASSQLGMQLIRAITVMNPNIVNGQTPVTTWYRSFTTTGWQTIFGPLNTGQTGLANGGATQLQNNVALAILGMLDTLPPKVTEYQVSVQNTTYTVEPATYLPALNVYYYKFPGLVYVGKNTQFAIYGNVATPGPSNLQLFGVTFAVGTYLTRQL